VDSGKPDIVVASAAKSARTAYQPSRAHSVIVRREGDQPWQVISKGLPEADGSAVFQFIADESNPGVFYAISNLGLFTSLESGLYWEQKELDCAKEIKKRQVKRFVAV